MRNLISGPIILILLWVVLKVYARPGAQLSGPLQDPLGAEDHGLNMYGPKLDDIIAVRNKRSDARRHGRTNRHRNKNRRGPVGGRKQPKRNKEHEITVTHFVVDLHHQMIVRNGTDAFTGPVGAVLPFWKFASRDFKNKQTFADLNSDGTVTIKQTGLYMIYSQITYFDGTGRWSHTIAINSENFVKCMANEWGIGKKPGTDTHLNTIHNCHTSGVAYLNKNDVVSIKSWYKNRVVHTDKDMTFWGMIKLA